MREEGRPPPSLPQGGGEERGEKLKRNTQVEKTILTKQNY